MAMAEFWERHWQSKRAERRQAMQEGKVILSRVGSRLHVVAPFNIDFRAGATELCGRYRRRSSVWSFDGRSERLVLDLIRRVYGDAALR